MRFSLYRADLRPMCETLFHQLHRYGSFSFSIICDSRFLSFFGSFLFEFSISRSIALENKCYTFLLFLRVRGKAILRSDTIVPRYILGFHLFFFPSSGVAHLPTLPRLRLYSSLSSHIESGVCSLSKKNIYLYRYLYLYLSLYIYTPLPHEERKEKGGTADL